MDCNDNCPGVSNSDQLDSDNDGLGDACDTMEEPSAEEQIANILTFFEQSVAEGNLEGRGNRRWLAKRRVMLMRKALQRAAILIERGRAGAACWKLQWAFKHCDGQPRPSDYVTGNAAPELANMIQDLRDSLGCK